MILDFGPPPARERYVPNDIGPSPEEWLAPRLEQVSTLITNGFVGTATPFYTDHTGVKYLYGQNVRQNYVTEDGIRYITKSFHEDQSKTRLRTGDILTVQSGHIGVTAVVPPSLDGANCHALIVTRLTKQYANPDFVSQYLNSEIGKARLRGLEVGSTILHINTKDLKKFRIPLPALAEQERIVDFLKTWDRAIDTVEALIANARAQKRALMQQLLPQGTTPPKKRLLGFSGEWRETTIENVASVLVSNVDKKSVSGERPVRLCNYMDVYRSDQIVSDMDFMAATATEAQIRKFGLMVGDVIITKDSETPDDIAIPTIVQSTSLDLVCGYHLAILRPKEATDGQFLKFFFEHPGTRHFFASRANGATRFGLTVGAIETAPINLPSLAEQKEIGNVILTAETEIHRLNPILSALRQEKAALMQQLLTGKRRVKLPESEVV